VKLSSPVLLVALLASSAFGGEAAPKFTRKPAATRAGAGAKIEFAVDRATDVAVFIENGKGEVVRHLVAGVLGRNAPKPLKPGLAQSIAWDGKADYGKPAGVGPFKVRVALGMSAKFGKVIGEQPQAIGGVRGIVVSPSGELLVASGFGAGVPNWGGWTLKAYSRDGKYASTIFPSPSHFTKQDFKALGVATAIVDGRDVPVYSTIRTRGYFPETLNRRAAMAVTPGGQILMAMNNGSISAIKRDGRAAWGRFRGKRLFAASRRWHGRPFLAVGSDGKSLFVCGWPLARKGGFAVCKVTLPARDKAEVFFGDDVKKGAGKKLLGGRGHGLAVDGKGHLLVADPGNGRVLVISEKDASYVGEMKVKNPDCVLVNRKNGNVYVSSDSNGTVELLKFASWKAPAPAARLKLKRNGAHSYPWVFAIDTGGNLPVIWAGGDYGGLKRIEDRGGKLLGKEICDSNKVGNGAFVDLTVSRYTKEKEIFARIGAGRWLRYKEASGKKGLLNTRTAVNQGCCIEVGPDGTIYAPAYSQDLLKFDNSGRPSPWKAGGFYPPPAKGKNGKPAKRRRSPANGRYVPVSMVFMTHTLGIRHDGHLFMLEPGHPGGRPPKMMMEYLPDGTRLKQDPIIWKVSDVAVGPKFDAQGNIYIAEQLKPLNQPHPPEFNALVGKVTIGKKNASFQNRPAGTILGMYGSILKFSPKGGTVHWGGENPYKGKPRLDPALKTVDATWYNCERAQYLNPVKVTGAEWIKMGISHIERHYCNCESTRFDVDEFGRVFYPDLLRYQIRVIDTNANDIMHVGTYGNTDDPLRADGSSQSAIRNPRSAVYFSWLAGVAVTDKHMYAGDSANRRLTQLKIVYATEETAAIK
jgi:DNA-binding beta-propeller fold protein YncE